MNLVLPKLQHHCHQLNVYRKALDILIYKEVLQPLGQTYWATEFLDCAFNRHSKMCDLFLLFNLSPKLRSQITGMSFQKLYDLILTIDLRFFQLRLYCQIMYLSGHRYLMHLQYSNSETTSNSISTFYTQLFQPFTSVFPRHIVEVSH